MKKNISTTNNVDKNFTSRLMNILTSQGKKVDVQYLCSAPAPIKIKKD